MAWLVTKYLITAAIVVLVSEIAKRSDRIGALILALPIVTLLSLLWLHIEGQPVAKLAELSRYTFWYVVPTLPMFLLFPPLATRYGFWPALLAGILLTLACFVLTAVIMRRFGIQLL